MISEHRATDLDGSTDNRMSEKRLSDRLADTGNARWMSVTER